MSATSSWAWRLGLLVGVLVVGAGLLAGPYRFLFGSVAGSTAQAARVAPCLPGEAMEIMDSPHVSQAEAGDVVYNSVPPTSGPHFAFTVAPGVYDRPVADGLTIHAMEHGHVIVHYAPDLPGDQRAGLERIARRYSAEVVLAPNPDLDSGIALTAWGHLDRLDRYQERRVSDFVESLAGRYQHGWVSPVDCPP